MDKVMKVKTHKPPVPERDVREQLHRVLGSARFKKSDRMARFLRYLVEAKLSTGGTPKEREIAHHVFDKHDFDSRVDPIVRVEARRLRNLLRAYYESDGAADEVVLSLATRGYLMRYTSREAGVAEAAVNRVAVLPFVNMTNDPLHEPFCHGVTQELISALGQMDTIKVASRTSASQYDQPKDIREICRELGVAAVLEGSVRIDEQRVRIIAELSAEDGFQYWSRTFDGNTPEGLDLEERLGTAIAHSAQQNLRREA